MMRILFLIILIQLVNHSQTVMNNLPDSRSDSTYSFVTKSSLEELKQILRMERYQNPFTIQVEKETNKMLAEVYNPSLYYQPYLQLQEGLGAIETGKINLKYALRLQPKFLEANEMGLFGKNIFIYECCCSRLCTV